MPGNIIESLKFFGGAILLIGFFYFIFIRAFNTKNYKRKSFYIFISGLIIFLIFIGAMVYDIINGLDLKNAEINYFAYPIVSLTFLIFFTLFYYIKGYKARQKFKSSFEKQIKNDKKPTIKNKKENLYIILKYNNNFLLTKVIEKEEIFYKGITIKFPHNEFFHDELVRDYISKNELDIISYNQVGKATKKEKNDIVYYCYKIILNSYPEKIEGLEEVDSYQLVSKNLKDMDKRIIFTSVVENNFDIDIK